MKKYTYQVKTVWDEYFAYDTYCLEHGSTALSKRQAFIDVLLEEGVFKYEDFEEDEDFLQYIPDVTLEQILIDNNIYVEFIEEMESDLIGPEFAEAWSKYQTMCNLIEDIAFAVRDRYNAIEEDDELSEKFFKEEDSGYDIDEFMNALAEETDQLYNGGYTFRPDAFWKPSNC